MYATLQSVCTQGQELEEWLPNDAVPAGCVALLQAT